MNKQPFRPHVLTLSTVVLAFGQCLMPYTLAYASGGVPHPSLPESKGSAPLKSPVVAKAPTVQKSVMRMTTQPSVPLPPVEKGSLRPAPLGPGVSLLSQQFDLSRPVSTADIAAWKRAIHAGLSPDAEARLQIQIGEYEMAKHEPADAEHRFLLADTIVSSQSRDKGLAEMDEGISLYLRGAFEESKDAIRRLMESPYRGYDRRFAALLSRHSENCYGYHFNHAALGIPEPPRLDPLCGVSAIAVCLKGLGINRSRSSLLTLVPHDGEGSSMLDLSTGCSALRPLA